MKKEDLKVIENIIVLLFMAWPCVLLFVDSLFLNFLGAFYMWEYWKGVLRPIYRKYREICLSSD
jgi:hypothetical protein